MLENIKAVKFGAPAAERDINQGLKKYFIETGAFDRLKSNKKSIILGNRGTGKSALMKMLADYYKNQGSIVIEMTPENYSYDLLQSTMIKEEEGSWAKVSAFTAAWKYLLYVLAMKKYASTLKKVVFKTTAKNIHKYLRDNHKLNSNSFLDIFISYLKRIEGFKIGTYEAGIKTKQLQDLFKLEELLELLPELEKLTDKKPIIILIDELDIGWDASEDAQLFVAGLFQAVLALNEMNDNFRIIISLRKELHNNIPTLYEDYQKNIDLFENLEWDEESLFKLITERIKYSITDLRYDSIQEIWNVIFEEEVLGRSSFEYIVSRSLYRPREIIQLCTESQNRAVEKRVDKIGVNSIVTAEAKYSENRTKDISAEYKFQYSHLINLFEVFRGKNCYYTRVELEEFCQKILNGDIKTGVKLEWMDGQNEEYLINVLWQVGFLSAKTSATIKNKSCDDFWGPHQVSLVNLSNINNFAIHPMFRLYLGIKEDLDIE
ncbi:MAG: hypothetical protein PF638_15535 [Candidatus Delongbacteria bacterium]|jgi:energy-coupling factor transporter ATP-binding protein EcfA2|nr:hypothetical protein [Candidatus Delongbacteria bacterium]